MEFAAIYQQKTLVRWDLLQLDIPISPLYNHLGIPGEKRSYTVPDDETSRQEKPTHLGPTLKIDGTLVGQEDIIIRGQFYGKIDSGDHNLLIDRDASVEADLHAKNITILGKVKGHALATGKIFIGNDAEMIGNISASRIAIQNGAKFKGSVRMLPEKR